MRNAHAECEFYLFFNGAADIIEWSSDSGSRGTIVEDLSSNRVRDNWLNSRKLQIRQTLRLPTYPWKILPHFIRGFIRQTVHSLRASGRPKIPRDFASQACMTTHGFCNFRYNLSYFRRFSLPPCLTGSLNFCAYNFSIATLVFV